MNKNQKPIILVWEVLPILNGGQRVTLETIDLTSNFFDFVFLIPSCGQLSNELDKRRIPYHCVGSFGNISNKKSLASLIKYEKEKKCIQKNAIKIVNYIKPNLIYCPGSTALCTAIVVGKKTNTPVIWHLHHYFNNFLTRFIINIYSLSKTLCSIISVSDFVGQQIKSNKAKNKLCTVYNAVNPSFYNKNYVVEDIKLLIKKYEFVFAHIGFIGEAKNQMFSLQVLNKFLINKIDALLIFVGEKKVNPSYYLKLKNFIDEKNMKDNVLFLGQRNDINYIIPSLDTVIIPSVEGCPLVFFETVLSGVSPCVINYGGAYELSKKFNIGESFDINNVDSAIKAFNIAKQQKNTFDCSKLIKFCSKENYANLMCNIFWKAIKNEQKK